MAAPSVVGIWNRALQLLGASRVQDVADTSKNAIACRACYESVRDALYESRVWRFTILQATVAADSPAPEWGKANSFTVPTNFLMLAPDFEEDNTLAKDWEVQNGKIFTDDSAPLRFRYVSKIEDPNKMPATFRELLSYEMAIAMCEELTQSNTKKAALEGQVRDRIGPRAYRTNSRLTRSQVPPDSPFVTARR